MKLLNKLTTSGICILTSAFLSAFFFSFLFFLAFFFFLVPRDDEIGQLIKGLPRVVFLSIFKPLKSTKRLFQSTESPVLKANCESGSGKS